MTVTLTPVTRENWLEALALQVKQEQSNFVPTAAVSLAKVHIKPDGDEVEYVPFAIYHEETMVGFMMHAFEENTTDMYWINGFFIDSRYQGKGYGKAALQSMIGYIRSRFAQCKEIRLTVYPNNVNAYHLYRSAGFVETGERMGDELILRMPVASA